MTEKDSADDKKFLYALNEAIMGMSSSWFGEQAVEIIFEEKIERRYSFLFKVRVCFSRTPDRRLIVKMPRMPWMTRLDDIISHEKLRHEAKMEAEILGGIFHHVQESGFNFLAAIRIYGHLPDFCAIVMEDLPFKLLKNEVAGHRVLFTSEQKWQTFLQNVGQAAKWLRLFHEENQLETMAKLQGTEIENEMGIAFRRLEAVSGLDLANTRSQLGQMFETILNEPILQASLHNDFHLGNIFVTSAGKIGSFDPNWETTGPILVDIARILIDLETRRFQVLTFGNFLSKQRNEEYKSSFLKGYFQDGAVNEKLVRFFCVLELVKKWRVNEEYFESNNFKGLNFIKRFLLNWSRRYFGHLIAQYMAD